MSAASATLLVAAVLLCTFLTIVANRAVKAWLQFRGQRLVTCPETQAPAAVAVDALGVAATSALDGQRLVLSRCSRWPEREHCGQECLKQIESAPDACLVRTVVDQWFTGKACAYCGRPIAEPHVLQHHSALLGPDGVTLEWADIQAEKLPELFRTHRPVCWNCHVAESFRRLHPELVTDRTDLRRV